MKKHVKVNEALLDSIAKHSPSIHEDMAALARTAEVEDLVIKRRQQPGLAEFKIQDDEEQTIVGMSSTRFMDRDNEIVVPGGVDLTQFEKAPVKLWNHQWSELPIGKVTHIRATSKGLLTKAVIGGTEFANEVFSAVKFGSLKTSSIGFIPTLILRNGSPEFNKMVDKLTKSWEEFNSKIADQLVNIIAKSVLLEDSLTPVPANIDATLIAVSDKQLGIRAKSLSAMGFEVEIAETPEDLEQIYAKMLNDDIELFISGDIAQKQPEIGKKPPESIEKAELKPNNKAKEIITQKRIILLPMRNKMSLEEKKALITDEYAWQGRKAAGKIR